MAGEDCEGDGMGILPGHHALLHHRDQGESVRNMLAHAYPFVVFLPLIQPVIDEDKGGRGLSLRFRDIVRATDVEAARKVRR